MTDQQTHTYPTQPKSNIFDSKITNAFILTIILQTVTVVWWAAGLTAKTQQLEKQIVVLETLVQANTTRDIEYSIRIARMEERILALSADLARFIVRLERNDNVPRTRIEAP